MFIVTLLRRHRISQMTSSLPLPKFTGQCVHWSLSITAAIFIFGITHLESHKHDHNMRIAQPVPNKSNIKFLVIDLWPLFANHLPPCARTTHKQISKNTKKWARYFGADRWYLHHSSSPKTPWPGVEHGHKIERSNSFKYVDRMYSTYKLQNIAHRKTLNKIFENQ